jgi:hypothetical protein
MKLEAVGRVTMRHHGLEIGGQVDNGNGRERTFLGTNTTTNAETLRNKGNA